MAPEDDAALTGGEQTPAPAAPAVPAEPAPHETAKQTVLKAYEQAKVRAAERDEQNRAPRAPRSATESILQAVADGPAEGANEGKPTLDRTRDPQGRFARGEGQEQAPGEKAAEAAPEAAPEPPSTGPLALRPPPGWSAAARAQFGLLPPEVKEAVAKREADVASGFQALQHYKGLETYTPIIEGSGINHAEFTKRAVEWEQSLKTNPVGTLLHVAKLANVDIIQLAQQIWAQRQQGGQQAQQPTAQPQPQPQAPQIDVDAHVRQVLREEKAEAISNKFLTDPKNIYLDEPLIEDMALLIRNGRVPADDLEKAYEMACWARPEIRAVLIREASAKPDSVSETDRARRQASEARSAAKATVGAPSGPRPEPKDDRPSNAPVRYDVRRAYQQVLDRQS